MTMLTSQCACGAQCTADVEIAALDCALCARQVISEKEVKKFLGSRLAK